MTQAQRGDGELDASNVTGIMLDAIAESASVPGAMLNSDEVLKKAIGRIPSADGDALQQAVLTVWYDLFRNGHLSPGHSFKHRDQTYCHVTDAGRTMLKHRSRDPVNPGGYLEYLRCQGSIDQVALSYVKEALHTFNATCFKAAAVMIGAATERLILVLRDSLVEGITRVGRTPPPALEDWPYKKVRDAITRELDSQKPSMRKEISEAYAASWVPLTELPRVSRNDAGHPVSIDPVKPEDVHVSLLLFPALAGLCAKLTVWAEEHYVQP